MCGETTSYAGVAVAMIQLGGQRAGIKVLKLFTIRGKVDIGNPGS